MHPRSADPEVTTVDLPASEVGPSYVLVESIGGGATGQVWRAVDRNSGDQVAVKLLRRELLTERKAVTRFVQERSILLMLRHPHIVGVRDLLTIGDSLGLVMDLVPGGSLREYVRERGTLPPATASDVLAQVADALAEAHRLGIVHRDVKPDNVLIDVDPDADTDIGGGSDADPAGGPHARLTDFGIARLLESPGMTTTQALVGTPNYLAPEVITGGAPSPAMDVYALGVLLYELLLGRPPYGGSQPVVVLRRHVECAPQRYPGVPDEAWQAILACMAKDPERRPTAESLVTTMRSLARLSVDEPAAPPAPPAAPDEPTTGSPLRGAVPPDEPAAGAPPGPRLGTGSGSRSQKGHGGSGRPRPGGSPRPAGRRLTRRWRPLTLILAGAVAVTALAVAAGAAGLPDWLGALRGTPPADSARPYAAEQPPPREPTSPGASASPGSTPPVLAGAPRLEGSSAPTPNGSRHRLPLPHVRVSAALYGPLSCTTEYQWDVGHPVVAQPCHATGPAIELFGRLQALPGVQADVSLALQEVDTGRTVAGPYTCAGLMFTDFAREHDCGPFRATAVEHGHKYAVVQRWAYTGRALLPGGTARSDPFAW